MMSEPVQSHSTKSLQEAYLELYLNPVFSDLTITCQDTSFRVHKCMMAMKDILIYSANYEINEVSSKSLDTFLRFIYTGTISVPLEMIDDIMILSQKFNIPSLKAVCQCELVKCLNSKTAKMILQLAYKYKLPAIINNTIIFLNEERKQ